MLTQEKFFSFGIVYLWLSGFGNLFCGRLLIVLGLAFTRTHPISLWCCLTFLSLWV